MKHWFFLILWNIDVGGPFGYEIQWFFFAGANFIALRRRACSYTWLVERYACRVIPALGGFCERMPAMASIFFGHISSDFSNRAKSFAEPVFFGSRICSGGAMDRWNGACDRQGKPENLAEHRAWKVWFFEISWKTQAGGRFGHQIQWNFFAGANFIASRRRANQLHDS